MLQEKLNIETWDWIELNWIELNWIVPSKYFYVFIFFYKIHNLDFGLVGSLDGLQFANKSEIKISSQQISIANL
jgi:hypothetical protein